MLRRYLLPLVIVLFGAISITTLRSVSPGLVAPQAFFFIVGLVTFWLVANAGYHLLKDYSPFGYAAVVFFLILTLIVGNITRGSTRWISVAGLFNIQASQLAVPIVLLTVNKLVLEKAKKINWKELGMVAGLTLLPAVLIFIEPDLSTTILFLLSIGVAVLMAPVQWRQVALVGLGSVAAVAIAWLFLLQPYQKERVYSFIATDQNPQANYHARQSMIAVGSGQIWGRGLGQGVQSHLRFLPERQTDFIFASLAEELGFVGSLLVIGLYMLLIAFFVFVAQTSSLPHQQYYIYGLTTLISLQTIVNIGMNLGLVPITGVTLPLISYGGSSVISLCAAYGVVQAIIMTQRKKVVRHFG